MFTEIVLHDYSLPLPQRVRKFTGPYRWRPAKPGEGRGFYSSSQDALAMDRAGSSLRLRLEWANTHLRHSRLSHITGYYSEPDGDGDTLKPIIARLPRGRGFLAGWTMGEGMCACVDSSIYEDERDAAIAAHYLADRDGEINREAELKWREENPGEF